jgi:hypothetical protein
MATLPGSPLFNPQSFRGTLNLTPQEGSSNFTGAIPLAGNYMNLMPSGFTETEGYKKDPAGQLFNLQLMQSVRNATDPEYQAQQRKQTLEDQLAYAKAQGDQMMKYRLTNDIISNLGQAAKSAFARYTDPADIANRISNVGTGYAQALEASRGLTQLGSGQPTIQYYRT